MIHGIAVQKWLPGVLVISAQSMINLRPTIMFGLGGIFVEVKDVTFRVAPVATNQALRMLGEIRGIILAGAVKILATVRLCRCYLPVLLVIIDLADEISESDANPYWYMKKARIESCRCPHHPEEKIKSMMVKNASGAILTQRFFYATIKVICSSRP